MIIFTILYRLVVAIVGTIIYLPYVFLQMLWFAMTCWDGKVGQPYWLHCTIGLSIRAVLFFPYYHSLFFYNP